jgi:ethanolamine utilization protein EutQ (cupin superfamily)
MLKIIRKPDAATRKIADNKFVLDYVTKDTSPDISFVIIEGTDFEGETTIAGNRIYFVLLGTLIMDLDGEKTSLYPEDSCFISAGTKYKYVMSGKFKIITVDQPAHG